MKTEIHPKYFDNIEIRCSCGNVIYAGSTRESLRTELCSKCHPFYTGHQKLIDTAGRVDRFQAKRKTAELIREAKKQATVQKKLKTIKKGGEVRIELEPEFALAPEIGTRVEKIEKTKVIKPKKKESPKKSKTVVVKKSSPKVTPLKGQSVTKTPSKNKTPKKK